jgi:transcriptional regulator with XRE-family HTH domain
MSDELTMGKRIALLREGRQWTQKKLAEKAGLSVAFISDVENDKRNPSTEVLLRLAETLAASLDYIATGRTENGAFRGPLVIPPELAGAAETRSWSLGHTADLLRARQMVRARRSKTGEPSKEHWTEKDWLDFNDRLFADDET